jgi:DNA-binding response OmpR family regulator
MKILIVEDDPEQSEILAKLFLRAGGSGFQVECAHTLREGIMASFSFKADVTYLDLLLPDVKDWRETVRAIPEFFPPVIVLAANLNDEIELECYKYHAQNVFEKVRDIRLIIPNLLSTGASAHLRRNAPGLLEHGR